MASRDDLQQPNKTCFADMVPQQYYDVYCQVCIKNYFLFQINVICVIFTGSISYSCNKIFCVKFRFLFVISQFHFFTIFYNFLLKKLKKSINQTHNSSYRIWINRNFFHYICMYCDVEYMSIMGIFPLWIFQVKISSAESNDFNKINIHVIKVNIMFFFCSWYCYLCLRARTFLWRHSVGSVH